MTDREFKLLCDLLEDIKDDLKDGMDGVHKRLDDLNDRTRKVENSIAVQWRLWLIVGGALTIGIPLFVVLV